MLDEELIKKLLATTIHLDFMKLIIANSIELDELKNNKKIYEHYLFLKSKLRSYEECCRTMCYPRRKKD